MKLIDKFKEEFGIRSGYSSNIVIRNQNTLRLPRNRYVPEWVYDFDATLKCSDGSSLRIDAVNTLITGNSLYKNEIIIRQIVAGIAKGYTPLIISANGKNSLLYNQIRSIYDESSIDYISEDFSSKRYDPFQGLNVNDVIEFFCGLVFDLQTDQMNGILVKNYVRVCVSIFFFNGNAVTNLINGQLDHMTLLREIDRTCEQGRITERVKNEYINAANSARSVSVQVLSVIQDYLFKLDRNNNTRPSIRIHNDSVPKIRFLNTNGIQQVDNIRRNTESSTNGTCLSELVGGKCMYFEIKNEAARNFRNSVNEPCFQWYLARTLKLEIDLRYNLKNRPIMLIVDELSATMVNWFWDIINISNSIKLIIYDDFYSKLSSIPEYRSQLIGIAENIYFFSVVNDESAAWVSRFFGNHMVPKVVATTQPTEGLLDLLFPPTSYSHDKEEKPWFSGHEIQHLGNMGIVFSRSNKIFKPYYRENGRTYVDRGYKRERVNFCLFEFE